MKQLSTLFMLMLTVLILAFHLPNLYERAAVSRVEKTHLFYSPILKDFIYTESTVVHDPEAAARAEDHHSNIVYKDARDRYYDRLEFEKNLPFIYIRNMDRRGLLPLDIDGQVLDRKTVDAHRQVLELSVRNLPGHTPPQEFWPLLNSDPNQAGLVFPDDRFRVTGSEMEFINADYNKVDDGLTETWTNALKAEGFEFPARFVAGNFTILKPFDDGVFMVDNAGAVYHLKRDEGRAHVVRTPVDPFLKTRYITVVESNLRQFHGLLLDSYGKLHLMTTDNYRLVELSLPGYDPETMDFKIIFDPINRTAVYSDDRVVRAVAMDADYAPIATHEHLMSRAVRTLPQKIGDHLFPFRLTMTSENSRMIVPRFEPNPNFASGVISIGLVSLLIFYALFFLRHHRRPRKIDLLFVFLTGIYGLIGGLMILDE